MRSLISKDNKKGQFLTMGMFAILALIFVVVLVLFFVWSQARWIIVGVGLIFASIFLGGKVLQSNKVGKKWIFPTVLLVVGIGLILSSSILNTMLPVTQASLQTFTPIFCNDYEFTCCNEVQSYVQSFTLSKADALTCPLTATKCTLSRPGSSSTLAYVGKGNCHYTTGLFKYWACDTKKAWQSSTVDVYPGDYVWAEGGLLGTETIYIQNKVYAAKLSFCGRSGCSVGVAVSGADQCKFNPQNGIVYASTSSLTGKVQTSSYTVPIGNCVLAFQSGDRHICGYKEESCSSNSDCSGHTYGNKECNGRTLQTYGCNSYGTPVTGGDRIFQSAGDDPQTTANTFGKRCEIQSAVQVQCCGDTDCGTSMVCDKSTFTCKAPEVVACNQNSDCGVSTQCDYTTKLLKTPKCNNAGTSSSSCGYTTQSVDCCLDVNCPSGYYCSAEKTCTKSTPGLQACPFDCCVSDSRYVDKLCPTDKPYCVDNSCSTTAEGQTETEKKATCTLKDVQQPLLGWQWAEKESCTGWCLITGKTATEGYCKPTFLVYYVIFGSVILILVTVLIISINKRKPKHRRGKRK